MPNLEIGDDGEVVLAVLHGVIQFSGNPMMFL